MSSSAPSGVNVCVAPGGNPLTLNVTGVGSESNTCGLSGAEAQTQQTKLAQPKVLYISYDGMTDPLGQSQVLPYVFGLQKRGYEFHVLSFEKMDRYNKQGHI